MKLNNEKIVNQYIACAQAFIEMPDDLTNFILKTWLLHVPEEIMNWYTKFYHELYSSKYGYPSSQPTLRPYTEDLIIETFDKNKFWQEAKFINNQSSLSLTHDIDHLTPNLKLNIKNLISERKLRTSIGGKSYLESIDKLLDIDASYDSSEKSTLFIACPSRSRSIFKRPFQWLIDPSYDEHHPLFPDLVDLIKKHKCQVGLHGSYYSLTEKTLCLEKKSLESKVDQSIVLIRQHWLHMPNERGLQLIHDCHFAIDGTFGWNGCAGFRGGMARPFKILLHNGFIWEIPLLFMDGCLCLGNTEFEDVFDTAKKILKTIKERNGWMAINWHERAAHADYNWDFLYRKILDFSTKNSFKFKKLQDLIL